MAPRQKKVSSASLEAKGSKIDSAAVMLPAIKGKRPVRVAFTNSAAAAAGTPQADCDAKGRTKEALTEKQGPLSSAVTLRAAICSSQACHFEVQAIVTLKRKSLKQGADVVQQDAVRAAEAGLARRSGRKGAGPVETQPTDSLLEKGVGAAKKSKQQAVS